MLHLLRKVFTQFFFFFFKKKIWLSLILGAMVADSKDQTACTVQDASVMVGSQTESVTAQPKILTLEGHSHMPKVRKPYTIRKPRERWTEEEHQ
ncbi:hypothetical protein ABTG41_01150, partial [Acinetobacter baumannii]